ncbi:MAG: hypothetical protein MUF78_02045 [Candidatus Edwardsbacteria bacterium]|nr:hypothetical protein [Candidatus Edwardsbacteria bacterium]
MMKRVSLLLVLAATAAAASAMGPGDKAGVFLTLPQGARPTAMGEAFCAVTGDIYSCHWNPAGLADVGTLTVTASMAPTYLDMYYGYVAGAMAFGRNAVSLALSNFDGSPVRNSRPASRSSCCGRRSSRSRPPR